MPRPPAASQDSLPSPDPQPRVKTEPTRPRRRRAAATAGADDDDDETRDSDAARPEGDNGDAGDAGDGDDDDDDDDDGSPNGRKRARINEQGDAIPVNGEPVPRPRRATLPRDADGYVPGSIVRVQLHNFVTYDWVEFRPGPNLNMILGPNGTGKSSIACALCIGLNGSPSILGRSSELNAFVKHGNDAGYVEIELKGPIGAPNLVIRRNINAKNRASQFTLNGAHVPAREISERIADLNIQVGNLCSFLPQDRVSEFAQMSFQQLLRETQRTAGDEHLSAWHAILIEKGKELDVQRSELKEDKKVILQLEEKQKVLEKDVKRYQERLAIERQIELLEVVLIFVVYNESKVIYDRARSVREKARAAYKRLEETNKPLLDVQKELTGQYDALGAERDTLKKKVTDDYNKSSKSMETRNQKATTQAEDALDAIRALKRKDKDRLKNIAKAREDISKLQEKVDNPPAYEDVEVINDEMKPLKVQKVELEVKRAEIKGKVEALVRDTAEHEQMAQRCQRELQQLDSIQAQKLHGLRRWDADCADVVAWFEHHRATSDFAQRVTLPAYVGLTVPNQRYVHAVEACFSAAQIKTFVTHTEDDFRMFNRLFIDTPEALGRKARVTVWYRPQTSPPHGPPLERAELASIGFDGYAIDYVECPEGLTWFLTKELNMHRTPVALDPRTVDENRAQDALSRPGNGGGAPPPCAYIAGHTLCMVSRSAYGQRKSMNTTRGINAARNLVAAAGDPAAKREAERRLAHAHTEGAALGAQIAELRAEDGRVQAEMHALKALFDAVAERKRVAGAAVRQIMTNQSRLVSLKENLVNLESRSSTEAEQRAHQAVVEKTVKERTKILKEFMEQTQELIKAHTRLSTMLLRQMQLQANIEAIDTLCNEHTAEARRVKQAFDEASARFDEAKKDSTAKVRVLRETFEGASEELQLRFRAVEAEDQQNEPEERWTTEKVEVMLDTERARLELNHATDAGVIQAFEKRAQDIESKKTSVEQKEKKVLRLEQKIQTTRDLWYPALTDLVTAVGKKFSAAFDRIGRAGEIRIAEAEDYEKWAIEIYVKFRDKEPLTLLTAQRQSGGERSLTTIMYLMSLTEHARAPFSLVDEINQGMDQQYERAVHDQLVNVTCNADSGQYFLITPKLLPGLQYHDRMKVLCVNNGEWLPDSKGVGNMGRMIDAVLVRRARPTAS